MKQSRRKFMGLAAGATALSGFQRAALALDYPTRPVRIIVGFPPGGPGDISARLEAKWLTDHLHGSFIVENRPGAAGNIGTELVVRSAADGYTLFLVNTANAINASLYEKLSFDFLRDIVPIACIIRAPNVLEVNASVPVNNVPDFIAYAKANPGKINFGSGGNGTLTHVAGELFKMMTGVNIMHVPYRGSGPAVTALLAGDIQVLFDPIPSSIAHIRTGKFRALAVTSAQQSDALPGVPPVADAVPGYEASGWYGLGGPKKLSPEIIEILNRAANAGSRDASMATRFADLGGVMQSEPSADFGKLIADDAAKWARVIKFSGAKPG
jgi:tripartite-type tricarboxylate transporter receptor subunit TctC